MKKALMDKTVSTIKELEEKLRVLKTQQVQTVFDPSK